MKWIDDLTSIGGTIVTAAAESVQLNVFENRLPNLVAVTSFRHPWLERWRCSGIKVFCLEEWDSAAPVSTRDLLRHPRTQQFLADLAEPVYILMFKPDSEIETFLSKSGIRLVHSPSEISRRLENKLYFAEILDGLNLRQPQNRQMRVDSGLKYVGLQDCFGPRFIVQFAKSYSGNRTYIIESQADLDTIVERFQGRRARATRWIDGHTWTCNACVDIEGNVQVSPAFFQITRRKVDPLGLPPTIGSRGNLWNAPDASIMQDIHSAMIAVGRRLNQLGYRGMYGLDFVAERNTGKVFAIEINPRLVASVPAVTPFEISQGAYPLLAMHVRACLGESIAHEDGIMNFSPGGQIIFRDGDESIPREFYNYTPGIYEFGFPEISLDPSALKTLRDPVSSARISPGECLLWTPQNSNAKFNEQARIFFRLSNQPDLEPEFLLPD